MRIRIFPLMILLALSGSTAAMAFNCSGISLPSSMVICSDPDLVRLADERQQIYNETRSRLSAEQQAALWEDQKAWVRSYASQCGVPPDQPPPIPASASVIECFKHAAEARATFLRSYGLEGQASTSSIPASAPAETNKSPTTHEIPLEQAGGDLFEIRVQINGSLTLPFIIDSGASVVQITPDVFFTLLRTDTIRKSDVTGYESYSMADGSSQKYAKFIIRELKVGPYMLHNVAASVVPSLKGSLLLGQSFLSHFDSWTLDNKRHVLKLVGTESGSEPTSDQQPNPMASLSLPALHRNEHPFAQTVVLCGRTVEYRSPDRTNIGDDTVGIGFLGVWAGHWNNAGRLCGGLIVEGVDPGGEAKIIYVYGPSRPGTGLSWKQQHRVGAIRDFALSFEDDQGSIFRFRFGDDTLDATFVGRAGHLTGTFERMR